MTRVLLVSLAGVFLVGLGYWLGSSQAQPRYPLPEESGPPLTKRLPSGVQTFSVEGHSLGKEGGDRAGEMSSLAEGKVATKVEDLSRVLENPDSQERERDLESLGARDLAAQVDWRAAAASIGDLVDRSFYLKGVFTSWASQDPSAAAGELRQYSLSERAILLPEVVNLWAKQDPEATEQWVLDLRNGEVKDLAVRALYRSWAIIDPEHAVERGLALGDEALRTHALSAVIKAWSANDLQAVGAWAKSLHDPNLKDFVAMSVVDEMSVRSPHEAMRWTAEHLSQDPKANPEILSIVASKAGFEDPRAIFNWLQLVPDSSEAQASLAGVASYLVEDNPDFAWKEFPNFSEELKDLTSGPIASTLGAQDPETGQRWVAQLPSGEMKVWATAAFVSGWAMRDPQAAEAWIATLPAGPEKEAANEALASAYELSEDEGSGSAL